LIGQLQDGMGSEFTEKVKKSWLKLFGLIVIQMKIGMNQADESEKGTKTNDANNLTQDSIFSK